MRKIRDAAVLVLRFFAKKMGELEQDKFSFSPFFIRVTKFRWHYQLSILHYQDEGLCEIFICESQACKESWFQDSKIFVEWVFFVDSG